MSFGCSPTDVLALTDAVIRLYNKGWKVAKGAPAIYEEQIDWLSIYKKILMNFHVKLSQKELVNDREAQLAFNKSVTAFYSFRPLIDKYAVLASSHESCRLKRIQFTFDNPAILRCRTNFISAVKDLQRYLDSCPGTFLNAPIEATIPSIDETSSENDGSGARLVQKSTQSEGLLPDTDLYVPLFADLESPTEALPIRRVSTLATVENEDDAANNETSELARAIRDYEPVSNQIFSYEDIQVTTRQASSPTSNITHESGHPQSQQDPHTNSFPTQPRISSAWSSKYVSNFDPLRDQSGNSHQRPHSLGDIDEDERSEIAGLLACLSPYCSLQHIFAKNVEALLKTMTLEEWLSRGVWYLLKVQATFPEADFLDHLVSEQSKARRKSSQGRHNPPVQVFIDFCKSCYIVNDIALSEKFVYEPLSTRAWTMGSELISALIIMIQRCQELERIGTIQVDVLMDRGLDTSFAEKIYQPIEQASRWPDGLDTYSSSSRWLSVEMKNAGFENERVYFRTFVNAEIARARSEGRVSKRDPYMLLLWSQRGRSEMAVTLMNQAGTLHLTTALTMEDLEQGNSRCSATEFLINFPSQGKGGATLYFQTPELKNEFLSLPRSFLARMDKRQACSSEFLVFRGSLEYFYCRATGSSPWEGDAPHDVAHEDSTSRHSSCEISLFEMMPNECWKTVRRMVISSSPDEASPWSKSYWLPLAQVQVRIEDRTVNISWSDCTNLETKRTGEYNYIYSYVYDAQHPNRSISAQFEISDHAEQFVNYILFPFETPVELENMHPEERFSVPSSTKETRVWKIEDLDAKIPEKYMAIVHVEKLPSRRFTTEIYFVHRELDFTIAGSDGIIVKLGDMHSPHYLSNKRNLGSELRPSRDPMPVCRNIVWRSERAGFVFASQDDLVRFMKSLIGWKMLKHWIAPHVKFSTGKVGSTTRRDAEISLWQRDVTGHRTEIVLAVRYIDKGHVKWCTATLPHASQIKGEKASTRVTIQKLQLQEGDLINISTFQAQERPIGSNSSASLARLGVREDVREHMFGVQHRSRDVPAKYNLCITMRASQEGEGLYNILHRAAIYNYDSKSVSDFRTSVSDTTYSSHGASANLFRLFR